MDTFLKIFRSEETRGRLTTTLLLLIAYRIGFQVPLPGMNPEFLRKVTEGSTGIGLLSAFSGGAIGQTTIFALGIMPYISASIIFSVLGKVSPQIEAIQKEGASGQKKINQWTRLATIPIAVLQAMFVWFGVFTQDPEILAPGQEAGLLLALVVVLGLTAGAVVVMWIGELITEHGIGNGASLIIMAGIIATMPSSLMQVAATDENAYNLIATLIAIWVGIVLVVVYIQKGERRIPIQYARHTRGRRVYGGQRHYLPLKVNMAGVMPIIFASAVIFLPLTIANLTKSELLVRVAGYLNPNSSTPWLYALVFFGLITGFAFFYATLTINPQDIASNLKKGGVAIPGVRPGSATAKYLSAVQNRLTLLGALFLGAVAIIPAAVEGATNVKTFQGLGATSLLILVGVAIDTAKQVQTYVISQRYEGMVRQ